jgi:hypothetical protein
VVQKNIQKHPRIFGNEGSDYQQAFLRKDQCRADQWPTLRYGGNGPETAPPVVARPGAPNEFGSYGRVRCYDGPKSD